MFYHYLPTPRPRPHHQRPSYETPLFDPLSSYYDDTLVRDPVFYRRLALEHNRKAKEAFLRAQEKELQQCRRRRAVALDQLRQGSSPYGYSGNLCQRSWSPFHPRVIEGAHIGQCQHVPTVFQPIRHRTVRQEPIIFTVREAPIQRKQTPVSTQPRELSQILESFLDALLSGTSTQYLTDHRPVSDTSPTSPTAVPIVTAPKDLHRSPPSLTPSHSSLHSVSFSSIDAIQSEFNECKAKFTFPDVDQLEFTAGDAPKLAYTSKNLSFLQHESDLTKLLTKLDAVESRYGVEAWEGQHTSNNVENAGHETKGVAKPGETLGAIDELKGVPEHAVTVVGGDAIVNINRHEHEVGDVTAVEPISKDDDHSAEAPLTTLPELETVDHVDVLSSPSALSPHPELAHSLTSEVQIDANPEEGLGTIIQEDDRHMDAKQFPLPPLPTSQPASDLDEQDYAYLVSSPDLEPSYLPHPSVSESVNDTTLGSEDKAQGNRVGAEVNQQIRHQVEVEEVQDEDSHSDFEML
ncbi:hypothetical protein FRB93_001500 [Tulasnella sp. JGI-2019a]|nr:hypothetical protein FRB93_001500 [Tulasnella sp. JGI-2019a]